MAEPELQFKIRDLVFEVFEQSSGEYSIKVTFIDGSCEWISKVYGTCEAPTACCYQAMLWMQTWGV